jgi:protein translocase SecG subunit
VIYFLFGLFFIACILLIVSVLLQPGKADAGALFTSNVSSTAFGPRGTQTILSKITIGAAIVFFLSALFIAMPAFNESGSLLNTNPDTQSETGSESLGGADANSNGAVNSNVSPQADTITNLNSNSAFGGETNTNTSSNTNKTSSSPTSKTAPSPAANKAGKSPSPKK